MFVLGAARELIAATLRARTAPALPPAQPAVGAYPGTAVTPTELRRILDEGFAYLSPGQRDEIFDQLHGALLDPQSAGMRAALIGYFAERAVAMRAAREQFERLTPAERRVLIAQFRRAVAEWPAEEVAQLAELLRRGLLPVPPALTESLLAALAGR